MKVITISRQFGSLGDEIASRLCEILNYRYFDKFLVMQAAHEAGLSEQEAVDYSEEHYKMQNFFERVFSGPRTLAELRVWKEDAQGLRKPQALALTEETALDLVQKAIHHAHALGRVVIVGRGGQVLLQNEPDVLHVRVEAPLETRIMRVKEWHPFETRVDIRRQAQSLIEARDAASAAYLERFYHVRWDDPSLYHLILNTGKLTAEQGADMLAYLTHEFTPELERVLAH
jgi:cytidylate kinase